MAQTSEGTTEVVEAVEFRFMTDEEVRRHSVVQITNENLVDSLEKPIPGGLYDPAMGPLDDGFRCKSCGQRSYHCNGHYGHIDLGFPTYNPLLFRELNNLLNKTCFTCSHFRSSRDEVESCVSQLELIKKGDIVGAKRLSSLNKARAKKKSDEDFSDDLEEDSPKSNTSHSSVFSDVQNNHGYGKNERWNSSQLTEAMSVLNEFLKKKEKKCKNCECKNPKITKPTFGWFHLSNLSKSEIRSNAIHRSSVDVTHSGSEVLIASNPITFSPGPLLPSEVRDLLTSLWKNEISLCSYISDIQQHHWKLSRESEGHLMYFLHTILVKPIKFRPQQKAGGSVIDHSHTTLLGRVVKSRNALQNAYTNQAEHSKIIKRWMDLQQSVNVFFDSKTTTGKKDAPSGVCQDLEKKEGIFRQNMMGKRVNHACRSVISPDPYLFVNEIGIPPNFALKLTYPERVTPWNVRKLMGAVVNGPEIHPGAITYVDSVGTTKLPPSKKMRVAISKKLPSSRGAVTISDKKNELEFESKVVYRHLQDGDIVLVNRQPTLHKPSIMAHVVRVLKGEKTLRMHYANCSSYNADFDGDEINVHFPQDEISRAEGYNIVNANEQYIVPTRGDTVRGLIQDHIVSAVLLTMKNTFLTRSEFAQLLYGSGVFTSGPGSVTSKHSRKISLVESEGLVASVLPAIWKPKPLWTGKQVITALLNHITRGYEPCTVENQGKIPKNYFADNINRNGEQDEEHNAEHNLLIWKNELVRGVIDKAQFGKFGLVHTVQELYGSNSAGILLSALSRLFTIFLQIHGFTCGLDDLIIVPHYDAQRKEKLEGQDVGEEVHCEFVKFKPGQIGPEELQMEIEKLISSDRESATAMLDMKMKNKLTNKLTREGSQILKHLLTAGLLKPFPRNCISVMTTTGAKGSTVNFQQISAYLGQQELEGKRVPRMVSGKTLPSFPPWDFTSRAGGFITDRFLTGLRPQEYYFHCMAGREGLVDTAVKTSRSGYLQRCLIKNLESLKVDYDYTVRDADGSIIQFCYGEDGVDSHHTSFLNNFKALEDNQGTFSQKFENKREFNTYIEKLPMGLEEEATRFILNARNKSSENEQASGIKHSNKKAEKKKQLLENQTNKFLDLVEQKYLSSLAQAGEPVGVIAAQSVGEPSTQMTLNTFHLAGRGEMNVTLGIPRLQEILMTASDVIKTPILTCPFSQWRSKRDVVSLVSKVKKVTVADLVEGMEVQLSINHREVSRIYKLTIKLKDTDFVSLENTHDTLKSSFLRELEDTIENHVIFLSKINGIMNFKSDSKSEPSNEGGENTDGDETQEKMDGDDDDDGDEDGDDLGLDGQKRKKQDEMEYENDGFESERDKDDLSLKMGQDQSDGSETGNKEVMENEDNDDEATSDDKSRKKEAFEKIGNPSLEFSGKKKRRATYLEVRGLYFEVHFKFTNEPHLLLAQIAQKAAKKVYIKHSGKISQCKMVQYDPDEKTVIWEDTKKPKRGITVKPQTSEEETAYWAMKASGVDFKSFWEMQEELDLTRLYSNNVNAMLTTYGVEAARATIIREVKQVFDIYGVKIDFRHLSLIADFMTHTGGYRGMSRHGSISESSPFLKMSFETASKFIVESASRGLMDNLETPSSRICLGLPVKMGTGSFELMQKLEA